MNYSSMPITKTPNAAPYLSYIRATADFLNFRFKEREIALRVSTEGVERRLDPSILATDRLMRSTVTRFAGLKQSQLGKVYRSQIATAVDVIATSLRGSRNVAIMGATQSGKSGTFYLLMAIEPVCHFLVHGQQVVPIVSLVNKNDLFQQLRADFEEFFRLHDGLCLQKPDGQKIHIAEYFHDYVGERFWDDSSFEPSQTLVKNSVQNVAEFRNRLQKAKAKGFKVIDYIDESHYGSASAGVFDRMAREQIRAAKNETGHVDFRAVSATNWEHSTLDHFERQYQYVEKGYRGIPYFNGDKLPCLDLDYEPVPPSIQRYTDLEIPVLSILKYESLKRFRKKSDAEEERKLKDDSRQSGWSRSQLRKLIREVRSRPDTDYQGRWRRYRRDFVRHVATIIERTVIDDGEEGIGICLRASRVNKECAVLMRKVQDELTSRGHRDRIAAIPYFGTHERQTVEQTIDGENPEKKNYVVYIIAGARMGVTFPSNCRFFVDLTDDPSTSTAEIQGTFGRATGYFRENKVFVSPSCFESIQYFIKNKGVPSKRPHQSVRLGNAMPGRPVTYVTLHMLAARSMIESSDKERLLNHMAEIERVIMKQKRDGHAWVKMQRTPQYDNSTAIWPILEEIISILERHPEIASFGSKPGSFERLKLLHWHSDKKVRKDAAKGIRSGTSSNYADENGRTFRGDIARRVRFELDGGEQTDRGRTTGGRETGRKDRHVEPQLFFDVLGTTRDEKRNATGVRLQYIHLPLRLYESRYTSLELTDRSAWFDDANDSPDEDASPAAITPTVMNA